MAIRITAVRATVGLAVVLWLGTAIADTAARVSLTKLWSNGPWRGVSEIIFFDDRVWFVNSNPFSDTNAADLYTLTPGAASVHYQRSLFSQGAGTPVVYDGHLYLPFEDPRRSTGRGEFVRTDGKNYQWHALREGVAFHVHAMAECDGHLLAATGAYTGQLQRRSKSGSWSLVFDYPAGEATFSRLVSILQFGDRCMIGAVGRGDSRPKLLEYKDNDVTAIAGWPRGGRTDQLAVFGDRLLGMNNLDDTRSIYSWDGSTVVRLKRPAGTPRDLAVDGDTVWLITDSGDSGVLWSSTDLESWNRRFSFDESPIDLAINNGQIFVGTWSRQGGALYGPDTSGELVTPFARPLPSTITTPLSDVQIAQRAADIMTDFADPTWHAEDSQALRRALTSLDLDVDKYVLQAVMRRIFELPATGEITLFTHRQIDRSRLIQWYVIGAAARRGVITPTTDTLVAPFTTPSNHAEKYFDLSIAAIAAQTWADPPHPETVPLLIQRLTKNADPIWLQADIISALTVITGKNFGHDARAWQRWQQNKRE